MTFPLIGFEGPIAAGKTTHATLLARRLGCKLQLEQFQVNEFLADYYRDRERWALPMQLAFVVSRYGQLRTVSKPSSEPVIVDYSHLKNGIFSRLLLSGRELRLYNEVAGQFENNIPKMDLVVFLDASNAVLLDRIRARNRDYESTIDERFLDELRCAYEAELSRVPGLSVFRYDTSTLDLCSEGDVNKLQQGVNSALATNFKLL